MSAASRNLLHLRDQQGMTLVELLVAMVVGLAVIGAGLAMYVSSGTSSRSSTQLSQMSEDANAALSLLRTHIAMTGYSQPVANDATKGLVKAYNDQVVFGCLYGVSSNEQKLISKGETITCNAAGAPTSINDTLILLYEADINNSVANKDNLGTDCLGNSIKTPITTGGVSITLAENRFYLGDHDQLLCLGNGGDAGAARIAQPLIENVAQFRVYYGVASDTGKVAERYMTAEEIGLQADSKWKQVVSIRICLVMRSQDDALDAVTSYTDCDGQTKTPTTWGTPKKADRRSYRAYTTTVVLHNRI